MKKPRNVLSGSKSGGKLKKAATKAVTGMPSADRSANLGKYLHAKKHAPLAKAGSAPKRHARELSNVKSMRNNRKGLS